jgi:hypothetical protein
LNAAADCAEARVQAVRKVKKVYYEKSKGGKVQGARDLGSTAAYTRSFAAALLDAWQRDFNAP